MRPPVHLELEDAPARLCWAHVASVDELLDTIDLKVHSVAVVAFVGVLVQVLDCFDRAADLHVQVTPVSAQQPRIVGHHPSAVLVLVHWTVGAPAVHRVPVAVGNSGFLQRFGIALLARTRRHADAVWVLGSARTVQHVSGDFLVEEGIKCWIRYLRAHHCVDVFRRAKLVFWVQYQ